MHTTTNRFDLEQQIMNCWNVVDDLQTLLEASCETELSEDQVQNALLGMKTMYQFKFEKLFNLFEQCIRDRKL